MNKFSLLLSAALLIPTTPCLANGYYQYGWPQNPRINPLYIPALVTSNGFGANPDRRRVAGSALILKSMHMINEPSIPSNAITKVASWPRANEIADTPVEIYSVSLNPETNVIGIDQPPMNTYQVIDTQSSEQFLIK